MSDKHLVEVGTITANQAGVLNRVADKNGSDIRGVDSEST